ncbi:MAG: ABC transporter substrate-binding protein [Sphingomonadales bacterium]|nr:ABC transporter substrate-binding protein [Sphingomonadales bacterium]
MTTKPWTFPILAAALALAAPSAAPAQMADPAAATVAALDNGLLAIMHAGAAAGESGRARSIAPVIERAFDLPLMARLSVGPPWNGFTAANQQALVAAFRALTISQYAHNFDGFAGEHFVLSPQVETRGGDKLVRTQLVSPGGKSEELDYRLRQSAEGWKIIDIYYRSAISQLATRRSDFAAVVARGGAPALIAHLERLAKNPA